MTTLQDELNGTAPAVETPEEEPCVYVGRTGKRCEEPAIEGEEVCVLHGASIAKATELATRKLLALRTKALRKFDGLLDSYDDRVTMTAVTAILDRTGHGPKSTVEIEEKKQDLSKLTYEDLEAELAALAVKTREEKIKRHRMTEAPLSKSNSSASEIH